MNKPFHLLDSTVLKATMKTLAALIFLLMFIVSCGGGADGPSADTRPAVKGNAQVFETPPTPGTNR